MSDERTRRVSRRPAGVARHGRLKRSNPVLSVLRFLGIGVLVLAVSAGAVVAIDANRLLSSVESFDLPDDGVAAPPSISAYEGGFNVLIVGSDEAEGTSATDKQRGSARLNDVNILLHVSEDQTNAVAVSFPRDLVVPIPSCTNETTGKKSAAMSGQPINVALSYGGVPCVAATVSALTGVEVDFAGLITFNGVIAMSNAVGGVNVCLNAPIHDKYSGFSREAGTWELAGADALAFLRSRHGVGDGSDLTRISSQQVFLGSLVRTLKSSDTLGDPTKVYGIANAALQNMQLSSNLKSADTMYQIALALKDIPLENVTFVQYPGTTGKGGIYQGKVAPVTSTANLLFEKIRTDTPFSLAAAGDGRGSTLDPNAAPLPTDTTTADPAVPAPDVIPGLTGQTAAEQTCSVAYLTGTN